jgi:large subunit ribosomal protein L4
MATQQLTVPVVDLSGKSLGDSQVPKDVFGIVPNEDAVHFVCEGQRFRFYKKTASTKGRSLVNGGGKKARKQKGSGMARQGGTRAPHWVGGGVAFGPKAIKRDFKINRKMYRLALSSVLADRYSGGQVRVLDYSKLSAPKSASLSGFIKALSLSQARVGFVVSSDEDKTLSKSVRNLRNVDVLSEEKWTTLDFVKTDSLVFSKKALAELLNRMERQA